MPSQTFQPERTLSLAQRLAGRACPARSTTSPSTTTCRPPDGHGHGRHLVHGRLLPCQGLLLVDHVVGPDEPVGHFVQTAAAAADPASVLDDVAQTCARGVERVLGDAVGEDGAQGTERLASEGGRTWPRRR